jgi:tRNA threonylcarbamoyladenosine biosynthesis protein TsaB
MILVIRTDKPEAEIGLFDGKIKVAYETWEAHRALAETLHQKIADLLKSQDKDWANITGIVAYAGPGSFTGLRIGLSVANALAYSYSIPIVGATMDKWVVTGIEALLNDQGQKQIVPQYGAPVHTTPPGK